MAVLHVNHRYLIHLAGRVAAQRPGAQVLDYGCGAGEVVVMGRQSGIDLVGVEMFYEGGSYREDAVRAGLLGREIVEFDGRRLPFGNGAFDLVMSNQVLEHVPDLSTVVSEIARVTRPGGVSVHLFPSRDVWREGHCGVPFLHRGLGHPRLRQTYGAAVRRTGAGNHGGGRSSRRWAVETIAWLDEYCFYRSRRVIAGAFAPYFDMRSAEADYVRFRLLAGRRSELAGFAARPLLRPAVQAVFRKLGFLVLVGTRRG